MNRLAKLWVLFSGASLATVAGCASEPLAAEPAPRQRDITQNILAPQRSAAAYTEAVAVKVNNPMNDFCSGVLVAPSVVLTAAHCIVFNSGGTWTVTVPFAAGGSYTRTALTAEAMDPGFYGLNYNDYETHSELHDLGLLYLSAPVTGVTFPSLSSTRYPPLGSTLSVSAVGRASVSASAGLVLSKAVPVSQTTAADGYLLDNKTPRVTDGGDSGGPLFLDGTHTLIGTETRFNPSANIDFWARLDSDVYDFIANRVASHGGWGSTVDTFRDEVSNAICARVASCCQVAAPAYSLNSAGCHNIYDQLGFESTARATKIAAPSNITVNGAAKATCLSQISALSCSVTSAALKAAVTNCVAALTGNVAVGGACVASIECNGEAVCEKNAAGVGTCKALRTVGQSCQMLYTTGTGPEARDNLAQELCSKRGGGDTGLFCDAYDFVADAYRLEPTWKCANAKANGGGCNSDQYCSSFVCAPFGDPNQFTCGDTATYVTPAVCNAFSN